MNDMKVHLSSVYGSMCRDKRKMKEPSTIDIYRDLREILQDILAELQSIREVLEDAQ